MKKYLMSLAAIALVGSAFVSCSNNDIENVTQADIDQASYNRAFLSYIGGSIAPDQDWGFSTTRGNLTRSMDISFNYYDFPSDATADKFLDDVPEGIELLTSGIGRANHYIDETYEGDLNVWGIGTEAGNWQDKSAGVLYVKGNCDFSNRSFYFGGNSELYLVKGATLTLGENNGSGNLQSNTMIYIAEGAKLIANGVLHLNNGLHIYNHGTIETPKLSTNSNSVLYNKGTVTVETRISVENTESVIVNDGTITAADLNTAGSGKFENNNNVTISGTTFVNSNSNTWVNNGQYHTGNFIYYAASDEVINKCKLTVDEDFGINLADNAGNGNFKMDGGSSVVTKNFYGGGNWSGTYAGTYCNAQGGPFYIYMGAGSVFKVTETATMNASKPNYGIYGVGDDFAVFQAKNVIMGKEKQGFEVTYGGNLAVVADNHFENGNDGRVDHPFIDIKDNAVIYAPGFTDGLPAINITETECNPGFKGGDEEKYDLRIIAEDLSASQGSDFDFNDIVIDVKYDNPAKIRLMAAGGTLPLRIKVGENDNLDLEVHKLFGVWPADYQLGMGDKTADNPKPVYLPMVNTGAGPDKEPVVLTTAQISVNIQNAAQANELLKIEVYKNGQWQELTAPKGEPACKLAVDTSYRILPEYQSIKANYPLFVEWATETGFNSKWW